MISRQKRIATADQRRIRKALIELSTLDDPRRRLVPYSGNLKGFWKLPVGDYRLICELGERDGRFVLVIYIAHRSRACSRRGQCAVAAWSTPDFS